MNRRGFFGRLLGAAAGLLGLGVAKAAAPAPAPKRRALAYGGVTVAYGRVSYCRKPVLEDDGLHLCVQHHLKVEGVVTGMSHQAIAAEFCRPHQQLAGWVGPPADAVAILEWEAAPVVGTSSHFVTFLARWDERD